jgi:hypothetical protein
MLVCAITATLVPTLAPPTASACQREPPGVRSRQVLPADGATGVPTNTRIAVEYLASDIEIAPSLALRTEGGTFVPHDVVSEEEGNSPTFVIAPRAPLAPGTRYWIYDRIRLERECAATGGVPCTGEPLAFATFTTGATADTTPPTSTGVAIETHYVSAEQNSCGRTARSLTAAWFTTSPTIRRSRRSATTTSTRRVDACTPAGPASGRFTAARPARRT